LHGADGENNEAVLQPFGANQAAMGQQPVVAQVDAEAAECIEADQGQTDSGPTEPELRIRGEGILKRSRI
jgi:hypothetical protein